MKSGSAWQPWGVGGRCLGQWICQWQPALDRGGTAAGGDRHRSNGRSNATRLVPRARRLSGRTGPGSRTQSQALADPVPPVPWKPGGIGPRSGSMPRQRVSRLDGGSRNWSGNCRRQDKALAEMAAFAGVVKKTRRSSTRARTYEPPGRSPDPDT